MLKRRIIPVLYLKDGLMVRSQNFETHQIIGHPLTHVTRMTQWDVDELIIVDISANANSYDIFREDQKFKGARDLLQFIAGVAETCAMPLAFGGNIRSFDDIHARILNGADKVTVNSLLAEAPDVVSEAAAKFGSQAIVASIDYRVVEGRASVFTRFGKADQNCAPADWARRAEDIGAGEIFLNAIDRDGTARGFDLDMAKQVAESVSIPVIVCGGAGHQRHFRALLDDTPVAAIAAGNIFHFTENAYPNLKRYLRSVRNDIR
jgi:cyclase